MSWRPRLRASTSLLITSLLITSLGTGAWAQAPSTPPPSSAGDAPASQPAGTGPATPTPQPPTAEQTPAATPAPATTPNLTTLPTITARQAPKPRPRPHPKPVARPRRAPTPAATAARPAPPAEPAAGTPGVAPFAPTQSTGAPTVGSGPQSPPLLASQMRVTGEEINARPVTRPGEVLESAPGLIVTQHSGEGKANQYFLRGYNLDHGTDMAIWVDDVPINLRTHAHGQGYSDLNWLMPETVNAVEVRKGPYYADEGDFGSAGNLHIGLIDTATKNIASLTTGSFGYERIFGLGSSKLGDGNLLLAGEANTYNGPWVNPDDVRKFNGLARYSQGTALDGLAITGMAYSNKWNSTDQVPQRAIASGVLPLYGEEDPTDGGNTDRFLLSGKIAGTNGFGSWKANAFVVKSTLDLYNNFTYFLTNPTYGDQFHQHDDRLLSGANAAQTFNHFVLGRPAETTIGVQTRYDDIDLALTDTYQRSFLSDVRSDKVGEASVGLYAQSTTHWTDWYRTTLGWRLDSFYANVDSLYNAANTGTTQATIGSPKFSMVFGPFYKTELFIGVGMGMHSNDARGATTTEDPTDPSTKLSPSPLLVRTRGGEVGVRTKIIPGLDSSVSVWILDQASEILFSGDAGDTEATRPSERYGIEWTNKYQPTPWLAFDGDLALSHARFLGYDTDQAALYASLAGYPQAQIGNAPGNYIPNAPAIVASAAIEVGRQTGWFGTLRWRYLGESPLTEDNAFRSPPISVFNGRIGYRLENGWSIRLDALNLFDAHTNQITYAYGSLIKTDSLYNLCYPVQVAPTAVCQNGVMDTVLHPVEPLAFRLTLSGPF